MDENRNTPWKRYTALMNERPELFGQNAALTIITDEDAVRRFEAETGRTVGVVYESRYHMMLVDLVRTEGSGEAFAYERIVPVQKGGIAAVVRCGGKFVLLRQFRHALRAEQTAFPRGFGEAGLSPEENLVKELREEIGANSVYHVVHLGKTAPDSGFTGAIVDVFSCEVDEVSEKKGHEGIRKMRLIDEDALQDEIASGKISDGFTLAAYALYRASRQNGSERS